ncbi:hypothetical protein B0T24DRAFT_383526 [Lasiosphaeria ovina]|uniref:Uncharacterized protein n=1 Tax=Lasiosphaeria ovina TaxID=92902 RepID=A0AAE0N2M1_9PEZI|nr:hypothetical protein B0T24DRAFT_383526 [Lasiosphaeria ovina]
MVQSQYSPACSNHENRGQVKREESNREYLACRERYQQAVYKPGVMEYTSWVLGFRQGKVIIPLDFYNLMWSCKGENNQYRQGQFSTILEFKKRGREGGMLFPQYMCLRTDSSSRVCSRAARLTWQSEENSCRLPSLTLRCYDVGEAGACGAAMRCPRDILFPGSCELVCLFKIKQRYRQQLLELAEEAILTSMPSRPFRSRREV